MSARVVSCAFHTHADWSPHGLHEAICRERAALTIGGAPACHEHIKEQSEEFPHLVETIDAVGEEGN